MTISINKAGSWKKVSLQSTRLTKQHQAASLPPSVMRKTLTSTLSEAETTEVRTEVVAEEDLVKATAVLHLTASQTHRQQAAAKAKAKIRHPTRRELAAGTVSLVRKASNASQTAPSTSPSSPPRSRETVKGADVSERGDPLLLININQ